VIKGELYPVLLGSALKNAGVQMMLDACVDFLPSPLDIGGVDGTNPDDSEEKMYRKADSTEPASALAFKVMTDPYVGTLTFVRVYSGVIKSGDALFNPVTGQKERVGRLLLMHSNKREEIAEIGAGHIAAFLGLKDTYT
jgi:elongation factor G